MKKLLSIIFVLMTAWSCDFLDPVPTGNYNDDNIAGYPKLIRGYIDGAYGSLIKHYGSFYYIYSDACTDNGTFREHSHSMWKLAQGDPMFEVTYQDLFMMWKDCYSGIRNANFFLKDDIGINTRYFEDDYSNQVYQRTLQGDAYGIRAWFHFMIMRLYAGRDSNGELLGIPLMTDPYTGEDRENYVERRATFDETCEQILRDCDSALVYLPLANKDYLRETNETTVCTGSIRYRKLDKIAIYTIKAFTYLAWASPSFCDDRAKALERYDQAARYAYMVFNHKMTKEYYRNVAGGYNPADNFLWSDSESPEIIFISQGFNNANVEDDFYPSGFYGSCNVVPSQSLIDAYPTSTGYPIDYPDRSKSGYDPEHPYKNRDPRFYSDIYYDESQIIRQRTGLPMYTFDIADNGKDAPGQAGCTSPTGYYIKKFTYTNYNKGDDTPDTGYRAVFYLRVNHVLGIFAEAANQVVGPLDATTYGMSAKQAIKYLRAKKTNAGDSGLGRRKDPYLDECAAAGKDEFDKLVRNELRLEFCWEGQRQFDLRRWGLLEELNSPIRGVKITTDDTGTKHYEYEDVDTRNFPSIWYPLPFNDMRLSPEMKQNAGWDFYR